MMHKILLVLVGATFATLQFCGVPGSGRVDKVGDRPDSDLVTKPVDYACIDAVSTNCSVSFLSSDKTKANLTTSFLVFGGGGAPDYNEIALEKNLLYFQRTLAKLGYEPEQAAMFFANGNDGEATIRYIDEVDGTEKYKVPEIPHLRGAATPENLQAWLATDRQANAANRDLFFYFTGHGTLNRRNADNNAMMLWYEEAVSVQQFANLLDQLPADKTVTAMMAQCYSGSFANFIYKDGNPKKSLSSQNRCGFFATVKTQPSVGCTPAVDESDYRDYSSSFFAGLSGRDRTGKPVPSADYDRDGQVSYAEAHAFAKVDEYTTDLPISTSEAWLQLRSSRLLRYQIFRQPISKLLKTARPEQRYVVDELVKRFNFNPDYSYSKNVEDFAIDNASGGDPIDSAAEQAYLTRLQMELINISMEQRTRAARNPRRIADLDRIVSCEQSSWQP
ncbi:hypothetical protein Pse7367_2945 [Thalassoporum mexicanum PCC 7367]|uniref:caspase family protein n=1 Tax=Thalassoporum mexicanum TaxID=3457544 RepID=UPI00029FEDD3|nr:caspase family protein [Pseudanabaena sp. PCC 7367]AFY71197.1 hypothetical protein Pse7367_2945 [Pseudanabaena sp. PCC 7367]